MIHVSERAAEKIRELLGKEGVPVESGDSAQALAARVQAAERELVIEVLAAAASGRLKPPQQQRASATS